MRDYHFYVYILSSKSRTLYIGMTNHLFARVMEHRAAKAGSYTARYRITRLVYVEQFKYVDEAIAREKQLKDWRRERKVRLIEADNATWDDLAAGWDEWAERVRRQAHGLAVPVLEPVRAPVEFGTADPSASLRDDRVLEGRTADPSASLRDDRREQELRDHRVVGGRTADPSAALRDDRRERGLRDYRVVGGRTADPSASLRDDKVVERELRDDGSETAVRDGGAERTERARERSGGCGFGEKGLSSSRRIAHSILNS